MNLFGRLHTSGMYSKFTHVPNLMSPIYTKNRFADDNSNFRFPLQGKQLVNYQNIDIDITDRDLIKFFLYVQCFEELL